MDVENLDCYTSALVSRNNPTPSICYKTRTPFHMQEQCGRKIEGTSALKSNRVAARSA